MSLDTDQVTAVVGAFLSEKMIEPDFHHGGRRRISADVSADAGAAVIASQDHGHGVPAQDILDALFHFDIARVGRLLVERHRVSIRRIQRGIADNDICIDEEIPHGFEHRLGPIRAIGLQQRIHRFQPFL